MNIVEEVKKLNLPPGKYVVVGSGPMAVRGLREAYDIDIVVTPDVFEAHKTLGWETIPWSYADHRGQIYLRNKENVELYLDVNCGSFWPATQELINRADVFDGIPFASLKDTISFKTAYNRPKHAKDIEIINNYLKTSKE